MPSNVCIFQLDYYAMSQKEQAREQKLLASKVSGTFWHIIVANTINCMLTQWLSLKPSGASCRVRKTRLYPKMVIASKSGIWHCWCGWIRKCCWIQIEACSMVISEMCLNEMNTLSSAISRCSWVHVLPNCAVLPYVHFELGAPALHTPCIIMVYNFKFIDVCFRRWALRTTLDLHSISAHLTSPLENMTESVSKLEHKEDSPQADLLGLGDYACQETSSMVWGHLSWHLLFTRLWTHARIPNTRICARILRRCL